MKSPFQRLAIAVPLALVGTTARAEASYEAAGQALGVMLLWALIAVVISLIAVARCIYKKSAIPLVAPIAFFGSAAVLTQVALATAQLLPDSQVTFWCLAVAISVASIASAWFSVTKLERDSQRKAGV